MITLLSHLLAITCFHIIIVPGSFSLDHCNFRVNVDQNLQNNGFHRNLSYVLTFVNDYDEVLTGDTPEDPCHIGLEQKLPRGIYFRPDEVKQAIIKTPVNIEASAEESQGLVIQMYAPILYEWTVEMHLLLHARYHAANAQGGKKRNVLEAPKIFLNCKDDRLICNNNYINSSKINSFCQKGAPCMWIELPIHVEPSKLTWDVPVGNTQDYYVVAVGTTLAVALGSFYLLMTIHEYMLKNSSLESKIE
ncbi:uncharacterized protein LOC121732912 [Aricia agestis]|uniref:uncharacterized protein LOC121732912 n=1 Tax=Aricia agestis TaxID=91739 RepID=UPI001C206D36|nr:uncharacterized protein LOC121732912 [Aricia agestis]